ncbi:histidine kinase [Parapedobacter sp. DT-150]|uniref:histidine kinase n=1 Tax=Parapedobacter sp. DT-150 TaxID=3396162 RepID=UPI003F1DD080
MKANLQVPTPRKRTLLSWSVLRWHLIGWGIYAVLTYSHNHYRYSEPADWFMVSMVVAMVLPVYYTLAYILHRHIRKRSWPRGVAMLLGLFPMVCCYAYLCLYPGLRALEIHWPIHEMAVDLPVFAMAIGVYYARVLSYAVLVEAVKRAFEYFQEKLHIANAHAAMLNGLLRFQINGHFQYGVLGFVAAAAANRGDMQQHRMMMLLSRLQHYSVEMAESRLALVDVSREIEALKNLVNLVVTRYGDRPVMTLDITGEYRGQYVPPVLLLTAADNTIKHGRLSEIEPAKLSLKLLSDGFSFTTHNRIEPGPQASKSSSGMGLQNLEKRLSLLLPNQYRLTYGAHDGCYTLSLSVKYASHGKDA